MKKPFVKIFNHSLLITTFLTIASPPAFTQAASKVIEWQPHPFGLVTWAGEGVKLSSVVEAVEIVSFNVGGKVVTLGEPFSAEGDWYKTLRVRMRNVSGQAITRSQMNFVLRSGRAEEGEGSIMIMLHYSGVPAEGPNPVRSGEEYELMMREGEAERVGAKIKGVREPSTLDRLFITVTSAHFEDGTSWASGCIKAVDLRNSCPAGAA